MGGGADTAVSDVFGASQSHRGSAYYRKSGVAVKTIPEGSREALWQVGAHFEVKTFVLPVCLSVSLQSN